MTHNRILIFSTDDHLYPAGGAEQAMGNITERLPHIEFDLICAKLRPGSKSYERVKNVHIHRMGFGIPKVDGIILALFGHVCAAKLMRTHSYDLIWSIMASYGAFSAVRVKEKTRLPFLLTLQEGDSLQHIYDRVRFVRHSFDRIFAKADAIQAISTFLLSWGRELGYAGERGVVIPNGVHIDAFTNPQSVEERNSIRDSFGFPDDAFILITTSRLVEKNGIEDAISALAQLPPSVCFVVCGSGDREEAIRSTVAKLGLSPRVLFKGFVPPHEIPGLMKASDAFLRPSLSEGLGNAFLEAMAARIPVIGTDVGGIKDFLRDGETGFVVRPHDPKSISETIRRVMSLTPEERTGVIDRSFHLVRERYSWNRIATEMEELFNSLSV